MNYQAFHVPADRVKQEWRLAAPLLAKAVARSGGRYNLHELFKTLLAERAHLWLVRDDERVVVAAFTTHVARYPLKDILAVDFIGGRGVGDWLACVTDVLDRFVTAHQLAGLETCARLGWKPLLAERGWKQTMAWYEKGAAAPTAEQE